MSNSMVINQTHQAAVAETGALQYALFSLRLSVFVVLGMWTLDKFVNPAHTAAVFETFYFVTGVSAYASYAIGILQSVIVLAFVSGTFKRYSYGLVLLMHSVSTFTPLLRYLDPWSGANLLFFAAFPMLAAIFTLYLLRDEDTFLALQR